MEQEPTSIANIFDKLRHEVLSGLKHGFFEFSLHGEIINGNKRRMMLKAGKTHKFIVPDEDIPS